MGEKSFFFFKDLNNLFVDLWVSDEVPRRQSKGDRQYDVGWVGCNQLGRMSRIKICNERGIPWLEDI